MSGNSDDERDRTVYNDRYNPPAFSPDPDPDNPLGPLLTIRVVDPDHEDPAEWTVEWFQIRDREPLGVLFDKLGDPDHLREHMFYLASQDKWLVFNDTPRSVSQKFERDDRMIHMLTTRRFVWITTTPFEFVLLHLHLMATLISKKSRSLFTAARTTKIQLITSKAAHSINWYVSVPTDQRALESLTQPF